MKIRTYTELRQIPTFEERYRYLRLGGVLGSPTFGFDRYLNQGFYTSREWRNARRDVIVRDNACDLAMPDRDLMANLRVHHMNPISVEDLEHGGDWICDPEFLICCSLDTHNAIHFGKESGLVTLPRERRRGDMAPWLQC